jgi:hypothetical protein
MANIYNSNSPNQVCTDTSSGASNIRSSFINSWSPIRTIPMVWDGVLPGFIPANRRTGAVPLGADPLNTRALDVSFSSSFTDDIYIVICMRWKYPCHQGRSSDRSPFAGWLRCRRVNPPRRIPCSVRMVPPVSGCERIRVAPSVAIPRVLRPSDPAVRSSGSMCDTTNGGSVHARCVHGMPEREGWFDAGVPGAISVGCTWRSVRMSHAARWSNHRRMCYKRRCKGGTSQQRSGGRGAQSHPQRTGT